MKRVFALSAFAALILTLTGCYGHGPLEELRSGEADKKAQMAEKAKVAEAKKAAPAKPAPAPAKTAPAK